MSAGCLQNWGDGRSGVVGNNVKRMNNYGAMVIEVFPSRIVFRRFDVRDGKEYHAEDPWTIPWPFDPATAPYRHDMRRERSKAPTFADGASLSVSPGDAGSGGLVLTVPAASGEPRPFLYRVHLDRKGADGRWIAHARRDIFGDFWMREHERPKYNAVDFAAPYFDAGQEYRFRAAPVNCWGKEGSPIMVECPAPERPAKQPTVVWQTADAMKDCTFLPGLSGGRALVQSDGFYGMGKRDARLEFPKSVWDGPKGARFRFSIDMHTVQGGQPTWTIVLRNPNPLKNAVNRISTPEGDSAGMLRYVFDFTKGAARHYN